MDKPIIAMSIPTGVGAYVGGYAGDFGYVAREFSKYFHLIINPNAVNGGILSAINYDMSYLEGYLFDKFFKGNIQIIPKKQYETNKIGVIFDKAIPQDIINVHLNTINALKMVQGINTVAIEYTNEDVGVTISKENGISLGGIKNPDALLKSASNLIQKGAETIAVVCFFGEDMDDDEYENANGIDPIGGVEAIISHLIAKEFNVPVAHAPAFDDVEISMKLEHKKVASELISSTYLPCVMQGLSIAPKIVKTGGIKNKDVEYLIVPEDTLGSEAVLSSYENGIKIVTVKNKTVLDVNPDKIKISPYLKFEDYKTCLNKLKNN